MSDLDHGFRRIGIGTAPDPLGESTTLYRAFDGDGRLLYVGIAAKWTNRWSEHARQSPFFFDVARLELSTHETRAAALEAERSAIIDESPLYNVVHNGKTTRRASTNAAPEMARCSDDHPTRWSFASLKSGYERTTELWLYPELDCSSIVGEHWGDGESQLHLYVDYLEREHPEWLEADAVPIWWSVYDICEYAPFQKHALVNEDFLSFFTWPRNARTGEPLDWFSLPVRYTRFPEFGAALGWTPSPLQPTAPLASILQSRAGFRSRRTLAS